MADHLNLAATCISVLGWPHWNNQPVAFLFIAAGTLPGTLFNPVPYIRTAQNLTSGILASSSPSEDSPFTVNQTTNVGLSTANDTTSWLVGAGSTHELSHGVTCNATSTSTPQHIYVSPSTGNKTTTSSAPASSPSCPHRNSSTPSNNPTAEKGETSSSGITAVGTAIKADGDHVATEPTSSRNPNHSSSANSTTEHDPVWTLKDESIKTTLVVVAWSTIVVLALMVLHYQQKASKLDSQLADTGTIQLSRVVPTIDVPPLDPSHADLRRSRVATTIDLPPVDPSPVTLQMSSIKSVATEPSKSPRPSVKIQLNREIPTLSFSKLSEVSVDPDPIVLKQSDVQTIYEAAPGLSSDEELGPQNTDPPHVDAEAPVTPAARPLGFSSIEQVSVDLVPVLLPARVHTGTQISAEPASWDDKGVQVEPVHPAFGLSSIQQVSVEPVPAYLPCNDEKGGVQDESVYPALRFSDIQQVSVEPVPTHLPYIQEAVQTESVSLGYSNITAVSFIPIDAKKTDAVTQTTTVKGNDRESPTDSPQVQDRDVHTAPVSLGYSKITSVSSIPIDAKKTDAETQTTAIKGNDREYQTDSHKVHDNHAQPEPVQQQNSTVVHSGVQTESLKAENTRPGTEPQLTYNPYSHSGSQPAHQAHLVDTLLHSVWPYGPPLPASEDLKMVKDFILPQLPEPEPRDRDDPTTDRSKAYTMKKKIKEINSKRSKEGNTDYKESAHGPGPATQSQSRIDFLFRARHIPLTEQERALKNNGSKRKSDQQWRLEQHAKKQALANGEGDASGDAGGQGGETKLDHNNPRNWAALGIELPIGLPSAPADHRTPGRPEDNELVHPPQEETVTVPLGTKGSNTGKGKGKEASKSPGEP